MICGTARPTKTWRKTDLPDFATIRQELQTHHNLTLQLVWEEYREQHPDGYRYSRYVVAEFMLRSESSRRIRPLLAAAVAT